MPPQQAEQELKQFKHDFEVAAQKKDRAALERMIHDDFTLVDPEGDIVNKTSLIDTIVGAETDIMKSFLRKEHQTTISVSGNTARETAEVQLKGKLDQIGDVSGDYLHSATYVKGPNGWQFMGNSLHKKEVGG
jgi:ketosteroid isomerase-like protein